ncbi:MAG TPA: hypothetical protein VKD91_24395 [Pyrinomonadaceae bacterium]|nr:hypothetical protein [Pyrinomonadaceae bacterium]
MRLKGIKTKIIMGLALASVLATLVTASKGSAAFAQSAPRAEQTPAASPTPVGQQDQQTTQAMDKMANTVTRAAETCETMMRQQMRAAPYMMAGGIIFGLLLLVDLALLAVLEVQWIKHWSRRLRKE